MVLVVPTINKSKVDLSKGQQDGPNIGVFIVCLILLKLEKQEMKTLYKLVLSSSLHMK